MLKFKWETGEKLKMRRNRGRFSVFMTLTSESISHLRFLRTVSLLPLDRPSRPCPSADVALVLATREPFTDLGLPRDLAFLLFHRAPVLNVFFPRRFFSLLNKSEQ